MNIFIASDHAGFELKNNLINYLSLKHNITDCGCFSNERSDYPDFAHTLANYIINNNAFGIVICGSGNGINMAVNKHKGIRSALCWNSELAKLARNHNNANVIALPARFISFELATDMVNVFLNETFEGGRHQQRIDKIDL
ncbi:MAG: ribose 5-phosphate isomerase B [Bacteroidia bacterium]